MKLRGEWVVPILEDLRDFADVVELPELSRDLGEVLDRHRNDLADLGTEPPDEPASNVVSLFGAEESDAPASRRSRVMKPG